MGNLYEKCDPKVKELGRREYKSGIQCDYTYNACLHVNLGNPRWFTDNQCERTLIKCPVGYLLVGVCNQQILKKKIVRYFKVYATTATTDTTGANEIERNKLQNRNIPSKQLIQKGSEYVVKATQCWDKRKC